jgi:hemerythrin
MQYGKDGRALAFIGWSEGLEIGVDAMDTEHRALIDAINQLEASLVRRGEKPHHSDGGPGCKGV